MCGEEGLSVGWWKNVNWGAHRFFCLTNLNERKRFLGWCHPPSLRWMLIITSYAQPRSWTLINVWKTAGLTSLRQTISNPEKRWAYIWWDYGKVPIFPWAMEYVCPDWMRLLIIFLSKNRNVRRSIIQEASVTFRPEIFRKPVLGGPCSWHFSSVLIRKFRFLVNLGRGATAKRIGTSLVFWEILMGIDSDIELD